MCRAVLSIHLAHRSPHPNSTSSLVPSPTCRTLHPALASASASASTLVIIILDRDSDRETYSHQSPTDRPLHLQTNKPEPVSIAGRFTCDNLWAIAKRHTRLRPTLHPPPARFTDFCDLRRTCANLHSAPYTRSLPLITTHLQSHDGSKWRRTRDAQKTGHHW